MQTVLGEISNTSAKDPMLRHEGRWQRGDKSQKHSAPCKEDVHRHKTHVQWLSQDCTKKKRLLASSPTKGLNSTFFRSTPDHTPLCLLHPKHLGPLVTRLERGSIGQQRVTFRDRDGFGLTNNSNNSINKWTPTQSGHNITTVCPDPCILLLLNVKCNTALPEYNRIYSRTRRTAWGSLSQQ